MQSVIAATREGSFHIGVFPLTEFLNFQTAHRGIVQNIGYCNIQCFALSVFFSVHMFGISNHKVQVGSKTLKKQKGSFYHLYLS